MHRCTATFYDGNTVLQQVEVPLGVLVVGADSSCGLVVEASGISPRHAELEVGVEGLQVEDLGSVSGTMVNGYAISGRVEVAFPATIQLGDTVFVVGMDSSGEEHSAGDAASDVVAEADLRDRRDTEEATLQGEMGNAPVKMEYALRREIARGGMGQIYEGTDPLLSRQVAVKVSSVSQDGKDIRFTKEAKILAHLAHPNIVPIYAIGIDELDRPFYSM